MVDKIAMLRDSSGAAAPAREVLARQMARFVVAGTANTLLTMVTILFLRDELDWSVALASAIGYMVGMIQGFVLSRFWTFAEIRPAISVAMQLFGFVIVNLLCGTIFTCANVAFGSVLPLIAATLTSAAIVVPISFILNRWGVFRGELR